MTHIDALRAHDELVQPVVALCVPTDPPISLQKGDRHVVVPAPTGARAGPPLCVAVFEAGQWFFPESQDGGRVSVLAECAEVLFPGGFWQTAARGLRVSAHGVTARTVSALGVNTAPELNRLSVAGAATRFIHAGTGGHRMTLNKVAAGDTASLLFQTGFSGRAGMNVTGSNACAVKVSDHRATFRAGPAIAASFGIANMSQGATIPPGSAKAHALYFRDAPVPGLVAPPTNDIGFSTNGMQRAVITRTAPQVNLPVTGTALARTTTEITKGRLPQVGDFGGDQSGSPTLIPAYGSAICPRSCRQSSANDDSDGAQATVIRAGFGSTRQVAFASLVTGGSIRFLGLRQMGDTTRGSAVKFFHQQSIPAIEPLTVGVPTGRWIEAVSLFRSASASWTLLGACAATTAPVVAGGADDVNAGGTAAGPGATGAVLRRLSGLTKGSTLVFPAVALDRWFA
ncbi:MAG: DUF2793 domain-containing protein [Gemmobacter sp.]